MEKRFSKSPILYIILILLERYRMTVLNPMDSWGSQDILAGFEPADPRSNRGESVDFFEKDYLRKKYQSITRTIRSIIAYQI